MVLCLGDAGEHETWGGTVLAVNGSLPVAQPQDVSGVVAFRAGPGAATFITGQIVALDGGYSVMGFW